MVFTNFHCDSSKQSILIFPSEIFEIRNRNIFSNYFENFFRFLSHKHAQKLIGRSKSLKYKKMQRSREMQFNLRWIFAKCRPPKQERWWFNRILSLWRLKSCTFVLVFVLNTPILHSNSKLNVRNRIKYLTDLFLVM